MSSMSSQSSMSSRREMEAGGEARKRISNKEEAVADAEVRHCMQRAPGQWMALVSEMDCHVFFLSGKLV